MPTHKNDFEPSIGPRIQALRESRGWSAYKLSDAATAHGSRISRVRLSRIENGHVSPRLAEAIVIAEVFNIGLDTLCARNVSGEALCVAKEIAAARGRLDEALTDRR